MTNARARRLTLYKLGKDIAIWQTMEMQIRDSYLQTCSLDSLRVWLTWIIIPPSSGSHICLLLKRLQTGIKMDSSNQRPVLRTTQGLMVAFKQQINSIHNACVPMGYSN